MKVFYCRQCGYHAPILTYVNSLSLQCEVELELPAGWSVHYICRHCGINGRMSDRDAPLLVSPLEADTYWRELQTDKCFQLPTEN